MDPHLLSRPEPKFRRIQRFLSMPPRARALGSCPWSAVDKENTLLALSLSRSLQLPCKRCQLIEFPATLPFPSSPPSPFLACLSRSSLQVRWLLCERFLSSSQQHLPSLPLHPHSGHPRVRTWPFYLIPRCLRCDEEAIAICVLLSNASEIGNMDKNANNPTPAHESRARSEGPREGRTDQRDGECCLA